MDGVMGVLVRGLERFAHFRHVVIITTSIFNHANMGSHCCQAGPDQQSEVTFRSCGGICQRPTGAMKESGGIRPTELETDRLEGTLDVTSIDLHGETAVG